MTGCRVRKLASWHLGHRPVVWFADVDFRVEQRFQRQRNLQRDELPLNEPGPRQREVVGIPFDRLHRVRLEHDYYAIFIGAGIVLTNDASLPEAPHVGDLFRQEWPNGLDRHARLASINRHDSHARTENGVTSRINAPAGNSWKSPSTVPLS